MSDPIVSYVFARKRNPTDLIRIDGSAMSSWKSPGTSVRATVTYVRDIYKYYAAYKLTADEQHQEQSVNAIAGK
jgi:hypothetical protein